MNAEERGVAASPRAVASTHAGDAIALVDQVLNSLSAIIHDRPVQQVVAAKLLLETGIGPDNRSPMVQRGLDAIGNAGNLSRDVMWALATPHVRMERVETDLREMVARAAPADSEVETSVAVGPSTRPALVTTMFEVIHSALADVVLSGRHAYRVRVTSDAEAMQAEIDLDATPGEADDRVWLRLAAARAQNVGGTLAAADTDDGRRLLEITLPDLD